MWRMVTEQRITRPNERHIVVHQNSRRIHGYLSSVVLMALAINTTLLYTLSRETPIWGLPGEGVMNESLIY